MTQMDIRSSKPQHTNKLLIRPGLIINKVLVFIEKEQEVGLLPEVQSQQKIGRVMCTCQNTQVSLFSQHN